jgi:hypothetical protein
MCHENSFELEGLFDKEFIGLVRTVRQTALKSMASYANVKPFINLKFLLHEFSITITSSRELFRANHDRI